MTGELGPVASIQTFLSDNRILPAADVKEFGAYRGIQVLRVCCECESGISVKEFTKFKNRCSTKIAGSNNLKSFAERIDPVLRF